jgi:maltooligosyltrehalose synthase
VDLPGNRWKNLFTGDTLNGSRIPLQNLLRRFPAALLAKEEN